MNVETKLKIPVQAPYHITDDAAGHIARTPPDWPLCGIDYISLQVPATVAAIHAGRVVYVHPYNPDNAGDGNTYDSLGRFFVIAGDIVVDGARVFVYSRYCHSDRVDVQPGDSVTAGALVSIYGNTGLSFGPHLHADHWIHPAHKDAAKLAGLVPVLAANKQTADREPWPGAGTLTNVDPTRLFTAAGLDVVKG